MKEPFIEEYMRRVSDALIQNKEWRAGQAYFNVLFEMRPDWTEKIRGTEYDPFYATDGDSILMFYSALADMMIGDS